LDSLKVLLIAVIIAGHAVVQHSGYEAWPYQPHREIRLTGVSDDVLGFLVMPGMLFVMGFFLLSGLVTPGRSGASGRGRSRATGWCGSESRWPFGAGDLAGAGLCRQSGGKQRCVVLVEVHACQAVPRRGADVVRRGSFDLLARLCRLARMARAPYGGFPGRLRIFGGR
jgi:hypothetical protein